MIRTRKKETETELADLPAPVSVTPAELEQVAAGASAVILVGLQKPIVMGGIRDPNAS